VDLYVPCTRNMHYMAHKSTLEETDDSVALSYAAEL
jgi:hypothetical protein